MPGGVTGLQGQGQGSGKDQRQLALRRHPQTLSQVRSPASLRRSREISS